MGTLRVLSKEGDKSFSWDPKAASMKDPGAEEAVRQAEPLLAEVLGEVEYQELRRLGYLEVPSPSGPGRVYRVPRLRDQVRVYDSGQASMRLCVGPVERIPVADVVLMHKLMI